MEYGFTDSLILHYRSEPIDGKWFSLKEPLDYIAKDGEPFYVPAGTNTDFASIPRGLRWLIPRVGRHGKAAVLHDWLCEFRVIPRKQADKIFLEALKSLGVGLIKRRAMYSGVVAYTKISRKK